MRNFHSSILSFLEELYGSPVGIKLVVVKQSDKPQSKTPKSEKKSDEESKDLSPEELEQSIKDTLRRKLNHYLSRIDLSLVKKALSGLTDNEKKSISSILSDESSKIEDVLESVDKLRTVCDAVIREEVERLTGLLSENTVEEDNA